MLITALPSRLANGIILPQTMSSIITTRSLDPPDTMLGLVVGLATCHVGALAKMDTIRVGMADS